MRILITGATGYVGGRLTQHLVGLGHSVIGTTRGSRSTPLGWPEGVRLVRLDSLALTDQDACLLEGIDAIVHLAAANELRSREDPEAAMLETCGGTRRLLDLAIEKGVGTFLFMSTVHVYGAPLLGRYDETVMTRAVHPYSISHKAAEDFVFAAHKTGKIKGLSIRLSNSIGAPAWKDVDRWTLVGNDLARQVVSEGRMHIRSPNQWRDFIPMQDVCQALALLLGSDDDVGDGVFNLGGDLPATIMDIAIRMQGAAKTVLNLDVEIATQEAVDRSVQCPYTVDIERLRRIGFTPSGYAGLTEELKRTLELLKDA